MNKKDKVHSLIKSLTKSEKGYFRKFALLYTKGKTNQYLRLFDSLEKQKEYDEEKLRLDLRGEPLLKYLPRIKNYLFELILKSLRNYSATSRIDNQIAIMLPEFNVLMEKGLYDIAKAHLKKIKKLAVQHEKISYLPELYRLERKLIDVNPDLASMEMRVSDNLSAERKSLEQLLNILDYLEPSYEHWIFLRKFGIPRSEKDFETFKRVMQNPLLKEEKALSFEAGFWYNIINGSHYHFSGKYEKAYKFYLQTIELCKSHSQVIRDNPKRYIGTFSDLLLLCVEAEKAKEFYPLLEEFRNIPIDYSLSESVDVSSFIYFFSTLHESDFKRKNKQFSTVIDMISSLEEGIEKYGIRTPLIGECVQAIYGNIAIAYFWGKNYSEAIRWINKKLNHPAINKQSESYNFTLLVNLIIHYEAGNLDLTEHLIRSLYRSVYNKKKHYKVDLLILDFLKKLPRVKNTEQLNQLLVSYKEKLEALKKDPFEKRAFNYFDMLGWISEKVVE